MAHTLDPLERVRSDLDVLVARRPFDSFDRHAQSYDQVCGVQRSMARELYRMISRRMSPSARVLEFGAGPGTLTRLLAGNPRIKALHVIERSPRMLARCRAELATRTRSADITYECCDVAELRRGGAFEVICSNATLQWLREPSRTFRELRFCLADHGFVALTTFGPATLRELRECYAHVVGLPLATPVRYASAVTLAEQLEDAGLHVTERASHRVDVTYPHPNDLLHRLRAMGTTPPATPSARMSRVQYEGLVAEYRRRHSAPGGIRATWEVVLCAAMIQRTLPR